MHLSTYEKELLALVTAVHRWRPYLLGRSFVIKTDQQSLKYILEQRIATPAQQKWLAKLLGYLFVVEYKKGCDNRVADALSRKVDVDVGGDGDQGSHSASLCLISFPCPTWIDDLKARYSSSYEVQQVLKQLQTENNRPEFFSFHNGLLLYKGRVFLWPNCDMKAKVLHLVHDSPLGGHAGFLKSYHRLKQDFFWHGMKSDLKLHIKECDVCQQMKSETCHLARLLQPLPIPDKPWSAVSMDFIDGLPRSQRMDVIMVVVDRLTKYVHFIALSHPYSAAKVAHLFARHVFKLHGMPTSLVSNRDPFFTVKFWAELMRLQGV